MMGIGTSWCLYRSFHSSVGTNLEFWLYRKVVSIESKPKCLLAIYDLFLVHIRLCPDRFPFWSQEVTPLDVRGRSHELRNEPDRKVMETGLISSALVPTFCHFYHIKHYFQFTEDTKFLALPKDKFLYRNNPIKNFVVYRTDMTRV